MRKNRSVWRIVLSGWIVASTFAWAEARTLLFVDDHHVLYRPGTKRVLRPLDRHPANPMLAKDKPWEGTLAYNSVYRDPATGAYRMWYQAWSRGGCRLCYAESKDGLAWVKPNLGLHTYQDHEDTNILLKIGYAAAVIVDPRDGDPSRRYKLAYWDSGEIEGARHSGTCVAFSPDGIHWTKHPHNPVMKGSYGGYHQPPFEGDAIIASGKQGPPLSTSDVIDVIWDPKRDAFAIYAKTWLDGPDGTMHWKRAVVRTDSKDFLHWSKPRLIAAPDEFDGTGGEHELARTSGGGGSGGMQLHSGPAFFYNDMYFATLQMMDAGNTGNMPLELALSHDGYSFQRPFRKTMFLPALDDKTKFDASIIWSNATPVLLEDEFRIYYGAYGHPWNSNDMYQSSGIGLATMPRDRFAAIRPIEKIGQITTKPIDLTKCRGMTINADARDGAIRVEIMNEDGYRVRGFSKDEAIPVGEDGLRQPVKWKERTLADLKPRRYKIRIHLENAAVYALTLIEN